MPPADARSLFAARDRANALALRNWNRGHWGIENRIHWVRDEQPRPPTDEG